MHQCSVCFRPLTPAERGDLPDALPAGVVLLCSRPECAATLADDERSVEEEYARREACHGHSGACGPSADVIGARECRRLALRAAPEEPTAPGLAECRAIAERDRKAREDADAASRVPAAASERTPGHGSQCHCYRCEGCDHGPDYHCPKCTQDPYFGMGGGRSFLDDGPRRGGDWRAPQRLR